MKSLKLCAYFLFSESYFSSTVESKFIVQSPQSLIDLFPDPDPKGEKNGIIEVSYANFGLIPYGHSMVSTIIMIFGTLHPQIWLIANHLVKNVPLTYSFHFTAW